MLPRPSMFFVSLPPASTVSLGAVRELGTHWLSFLLGGALLIGVMSAALQDEEMQLLRTTRVQTLVQELRGRIEAEMALGGALESNARAQSVLEDALLQDEAVLTLEVFDLSGISLLSTDRASIGAPVPQAWRRLSERAALQAPPRGAVRALGRIAERENAVVGVPIHSSFGEVAAVLAVAYKPAPRVTLGSVFQRIAGSLALLIGASGLGLYGLLLSSRHQQEDDVFQLACERLGQTRERLQSSIAELDATASIKAG